MRNDAERNDHRHSRASLMNSLENLIPELVALRQAGQRVALVTLVQNIGSSPRPLGSQMVVAEDGRNVGYLTGGCAEATIVSEAIAAIKTGRNHLLRLGVGSRYMDITLPCGSGIDLYFDVGISDDIIQMLDESFQSRLPIALETNFNSGQSRCVGEAASPVPEGYFRRWYFPRQQLLLIGKGPNMPALANLAAISDFAVLAMSPDTATLAACHREGVSTVSLSTPNAFSCPPTDTWTAAVLLFHEHDWEPCVLEALFATHCFYLGALGSRRTHAQRLAQLGQMGYDRESSRIQAPVGLDINAKTPTEIAISILAEITQTYRADDRPILEVQGALPQDL